MVLLRSGLDGIVPKGLRHTIARQALSSFGEIGEIGLNTVRPNRVSVLGLAGSTPI